MMDSELKQLVDNAGFVEDTEFGYKCSDDNISRLTYYIINQVCAIISMDTGHKELSSHISHRSHLTLGTINVNWESEPKKS